MKIQNEKQIQSANPSALVDRISTNLSGFTRLDLVAVIAVLGVLFLILLPALAKPGVNSKVMQCLNNHRQLCNAWRMYADDNNDVLLYASTSGGNSGGSETYPNNFAWSGVHMDYNSANLANYDPAYDMQRRPLWTYNKSIGIYKCPSDLSAIMNLSGTTVPRILSMAMNLYVGGFAPAANSGTLIGTDGGWAFAAPYRIFSKSTGLTKPGPAKAFVFIDMRQDSVNWGNFMQDMSGYNPVAPTSWSFSDIPGMYHDKAASLSFADGHTEMKRWLDARTTPPLAPAGTTLDQQGFSYAATGKNNQDVYWLQDHSTALK
ncbi:MAG: hypothetical protein WDM80_06005 [Limisphaerales bacterium]